MACIIYGGQLLNLCLLSKDLLNFKPPYRECWLRPCVHMYNMRNWVQLCHSNKLYACNNIGG